MAKDEYQVEGYNNKTSYDGPYLDGHDFDPKVEFKGAGTVKPRKAAAKKATAKKTTTKK